MKIKLLRYGICEKVFFDRPSLERYSLDSIGVPVSRLAAYGYSVKEEA